MYLVVCSCAETEQNLHLEWVQSFDNKFNFVVLFGKFRIHRFASRLVSRVLVAWDSGTMGLELGIYKVISCLADDIISSEILPYFARI